MVAASSTYTIGGSSVQRITTAANPVLALNIVVAGPSSAGILVVYPGGAAQPGTSNLNWAAGKTIANSVLVPAGTGDNIAVQNGSPGTIDLVVDCSGFFATT
jgi:hypothetical protein